LPRLSRLNGRIHRQFLQLFTPLSRDFPQVLALGLEAAGIAVRGAAERRYWLRAWGLIYEFLLERARLKAATERGGTSPQ